MARRICGRETELLDAIGAGRWTRSRDEALASHVSGCEACTETARVASALFEDGIVSTRGATVPEPGLVWWRMQMRARREAAVEAERTLSFAHTVVLACGSGIALAILGAAYLAGAFTLPVLPVSWAWVAVLAGAAWLAMAPVAVWLALTEE